MANAFKGEFEIEGTPYVLRFTFNTLCEIEEKSGINFITLMGRLSPQPSFSDIRLLMWGGLRHSNPNLTLEEAGEIISEIGYTKVVGEVMSGVRQGMKKGKSSGEVKLVETNTG